jgi:hypothetical protein
MVFHLELDEKERELVSEILESEHKMLVHQIHRADSSAFKDRLKEDERTLDGIMAKLAAGSASSMGEHRAELGPIERIA